MPLELQNTKNHKKERTSILFLVKFCVLVFLPRQNAGLVAEKIFLVLIQSFNRKICKTIN